LEQHFAQVAVASLREDLLSLPLAALAHTHVKTYERNELVAILK